MSVYVLMVRETPIRDASAMEEYSKASRAGGGGVKIEPVIIYGDITPLEGKPFDGVVLLKFEDEAAAKAWYNSESYQKAIPHRQRAADYRGVIVKGLG
jgi:uncharacterized protein (DUF1330 family)